MSAMGNDVGLIFDDPLDGLAFLKLHSLRHGRGKVDVVLIRRLLPANELNLRRVAHERPPFDAFVCLAYTLDNIKH
jgi:hypothetical protein